MHHSLAVCLPTDYPPTEPPQPSFQGRTVHCPGSSLSREALASLLSTQPGACLLEDWAGCGGGSACRGPRGPGALSIALRSQLLAMEGRLVQATLRLASSKPV